MAQLARYIKDPDERKRYSIDYSEWLDDGERMLTVTPTLAPSDADPVLVQDVQIDPSERSVQYYLEGGTANVDYTILFTVTTSGNQTKEDVIVCAVRTSNPVL